MREDAGYLRTRLRQLAAQGLSEDVDRSNIDASITVFRELEAAAKAAVDVLTRERPRHEYR